MPAPSRQPFCSARCAPLLAFRGRRPRDAIPEPASARSNHRGDCVVRHLRWSGPQCSGIAALPDGRHDSGLLQRHRTGGCGGFAPPEWRCVAKLHRERRLPRARVCCFHSGPEHRHVQSEVCGWRLRWIHPRQPQQYVLLQKTICGEVAQQSCR